MRFLFEDQMLDTSRRELHRGGQPVAIEPKVFDLLVYLVENRARVVSKDDVFAAVWSGRIMSESALTSCLNSARKAVGDSGDEQRLIRTIVRKGFRFIGEVGAEEHRDLTAASPPMLPVGPSIAVLPFANLSGDPEQEYFADGMVEDIIAALSRTKALFVIARNSSFSYKGKSPDIRQIGRELGVRYVLEGSVRKAGTRIRISGQLIDAQSGVHLWADRFDGALEDIFELQDQIAGRVVGAVAPALEEAEINRARRKVGSLEAYDYYLRGLAAMYKYTPGSCVEARALLEKAVALDPGLAIGWATQAFLCVTTKSMAWGADPARNEAQAERVSRTALRIDRNDARVLAFCGHALGYVCGHYQETAALLEEAVRLDPNLAVGWTWRGSSHNRFGEPDRAIADLERAIRLSPRDAFMFLAHGQMAAAHLLIGRYDEAVQWAESSLRLLPNHVTALRVLAASHALGGRFDAAREALRAYRQIDPDTRLSTLSRRFAYPHRKSVAKFAEGLRLAGMPE